MKFHCLLAYAACFELTLGQLTFSDDFVWGASTSAYQIEGSWDVDGKGVSIWDDFSHTPGNVANGDTGDVACDHYNRYEEDVQLLVQLGVTHYRFSISWPRIVPSGYANSEVNQLGIDFYNRLIDELIANNITPMATLYHWDLPAILHNETGGWLNRTIVDHFEYYADIVYSNFGDRVKHWITINEPWILTFLGYNIGVHAPGRNNQTEQFIAGHNVLLAHAAAYHLYNDTYNEDRSGLCGITLDSEWVHALDDQEDTLLLKQIQLDQRLGLFADPIWGVNNDYPQSMKDIFADIPGMQFTDEEKARLRFSSDYFGLNHYNSNFVVNGTVDTNAGEEAGLIQGYTGIGWTIVPFGFRELLLYIDQTYSPEGGIYVTENGVGYFDETNPDSEELRIQFYSTYIGNMSEAIEQGADVRGYFAWSLLDNFEWSDGFGARFGIIFMDYETLEREPKAVFNWYSNLITSNLAREESGSAFMGFSSSILALVVVALAFRAF